MICGEGVDILSIFFAKKLCPRIKKVGNFVVKLR